MASQHIQFQIGSEFSGEGFKAAQAATATLNSDVRQAAGTVGRLASVLGGMDGAVGKAAAALTGMLNIIMTMNPVMIGITAVIAALTYAYNENKKAAKELKDELNKMADAYSAAFTDNILSRIKEVQKSFEIITRQANDMTKALNGLANAQAQGGVIELQAEKLQAVMDQVTNEAKQLTAAEYDLQIAIRKAAVSRERAEQQLNTAHQATIDSQNELALLESQRAKAVAVLKVTEERTARHKEQGLEVEEHDAKRLEQLRSQIADIDSRTASIKNRLEVELVNEQTAAANMTNSTAQAEMEIVAARGKIEDLKNAAAKAAAAAEAAALAEREAIEEKAMREADASAAAAAAAEAERKATAEKEAQAAKLKEQKEVQKEAADIQKQVNDGARELEKAERAYAAALAEYEKNYAHNEMTNDILNGEKYGKGMAIPVRVDGRIMADVQAKDLENAIKNGVVQNVRDMDKFIRENARQRLREEQKNMNQLRNERQRYERLQQRSRKTWSKADTDFATKFEKLAKAAEDRKKEVENAKKRLEEEKKRA